MTAPFPAWLEPMAATLTRERFTGPEWVFERKLDGIRLLAFKDGDHVRLLSRNQLPQNAVYPAFEEAVARLPVRNVILDGEATGVWNARDSVGYHLFDILWLDGHDVHWAKPEVVIQVAFMEWTTHGKLRHPRLLGLRLDKPLVKSCAKMREG